MSCEQVLAADSPIPRQEARDSRHIHLSPLPTAPRQARAFVREMAAVLEDGQIDDLLMLTSELVTNAVLHARTPCEVGVTVSTNSVLVCVGDRSDGRPTSRTESDRRENGRGLVLVQALADDWGVTPCAGTPGKAVWFLVRRRGRDAPPVDVGVGVEPE